MVSEWRAEALLLIIALTTSNADIQKLLAFEGAFDKLFAIVRQEGGIGSGGIVVQDCLAAIGGLLRWNVSNQNYFRETSCIPLLVPLLLFPQPAALTPASLSAFAFQPWSEQKVINAGLVISLIRMLVGGAGSGRAGNQKALLTSGLSRCLAELALASNAPAVLKSQSLNALADILRLSPPNQEAFASLTVTPLIPPLTPSSHDSAYPSNDDGTQDLPSSHEGAGNSRSPNPSESRWHRGTPVLATVATVSLSVQGDGTPGREGLRVRAAAAGLFESYVANSTEIQLRILAAMGSPSPPPEPNENPDLPSKRSQPSFPSKPQTAGSILVQALRVFPTPSRTEPMDSYAPFFASLLFSHLLLHSETSKKAACQIYFTGDDAEPGGDGDEDERATLVSIIVGNLMMAQREQAQSANAGAGPERGLEWSRVMIGYLIVLSVWLWESPATVKEFLSEGSNLQVLIQPITQSSGVDSAVQGLCAFLLGICYEYNREPGAITRETLYPILQSRVGPDQFVSRILRLREDHRFRSVGPNVLEMVDDEDTLEDLSEEDGLWFDYAFVEFLKTNYTSDFIGSKCYGTRSLVKILSQSTPPRKTNSYFHRLGRSLDASESSEVVASLRSTIAIQGKDLEDLRAQIVSMEDERDQERGAFRNEVAKLTEQVVALRDEVTEAKSEKNLADKEQEDLLVLLEELSAKRKGDKMKMREAGIEVSEDEDEEDEEDADGEASD
ncbi:intracellular protein transport protein USO1, partial [Phenoliferia sp. Uapishka_3]